MAGGPGWRASTVTRVPTADVAPHRPRAGPPGKPVAWRYVPQEAYHGVRIADVQSPQDSDSDCWAHSAVPVTHVAAVAAPRVPLLASCVPVPAPDWAPAAPCVAPLESL